MSDADRSAMSDADQIAASMETTPALLPHLPALLQDLDSLGATTRAIVDVARLAGTVAGDRVLDVCCGKGAVAVALATELGCHVHGLDLFPPFLDAARRAAADAGVADRCTFEEADVRLRLPELAAADDDLVRDRGLDGVVLAAAGDVLGGYRATVAILRRVVRPGGWILIDDGFLPDGFRGPVHPGYEHYRPRDEAVVELTAHGDALEMELAIPREDVAAFNTRATSLIDARARELASLHPGEADAILGYAREQVQWAAAAEAMESAIWLLRKTG